jgi:UTP--glucose-1-phosphate uridylyltransferase
METPALHYIIEEGLQSGITEFEIIANQNKPAIHDYFSENKDLTEHLKKTNKLSYLDSINQIIEQATFNYIPQPEPLGLGHAILMAQHTINNEYFGIFLPDEIMFGDTAALSQLITIAKKYNCSVIAVQEVPQEHVSSYGIIAIKEHVEENLFDIAHLVEKPSVHEAPSNFAIIGRYIVSPQVFDSLKTIKPGAANEIQLTDGIANMMAKGERVLAYKVNTVRHDIGNPVGWLQANIYSALSHKESAEVIRDYIQKIIFF